MRKVRRFTIVELLMVIAIIGILMSLLVPSLHRAKADALRTQCASNIKQSLNAIIMYADSYQGWAITLGSAQTSWFKQPGISDHLSFKIPTENAGDPYRYRAVTLCPSNADIDVEWYGNICYGVPFFALTPDDYTDSKCEFHNEKDSQWVNLHRVPSVANYVLLADSSYTKYSDNPKVGIGVQSMIFVRRDEGIASPAHTAIAERHNGLANIGYCDAHVDTSQNKLAILNNSKIGVYTDTTGYEFVFIIADDEEE